jgi:hypothetical protein
MWEPGLDRRLDFRLLHHVALTDSDRLGTI